MPKDDIVYDILEGRIAYLELLRAFNKEVLKAIREYNIAKEHPIEHLLQQISELISQKFKLSATYILLTNNTNDELILASAAGEMGNLLKPKINQLRIKIGEGLTGICAKSGEIVMSNDTSRDPRYIKELVPANSELCIPLKMSDKVIGVLNLEDKNQYRFKRDFISIMEDIGLNIGFAIENSELYRELKQYSTSLEKKLDINTTRLKNSEEKYKYLMENAPDPILLLNPQSHIVWLNKSLLAFLNYKKEELFEMPISKIIVRGFLEAFSIAFDNVIESKKIVKIQLRFLAKDKSIKIVEANLAPIIEGNKVTGVQSTLRDITEKELLENYKKMYINELEKKVVERTNEVKETQRAAILAIANLAESIDTDSKMHLERIRNYSKMLAEELRNNPKYKEQITDEYINLIYDLSPLHDLGKVGIRDYLLLKPDKLTEEELEIVRRHTEIGADALKSASETIQGQTVFSLGEMIARFHHERWDGTGYPKIKTNTGERPLKGEEIPLCARIVCLADTYDALTSKRPYKDPFPHEVVKNIIANESGKQFDPAIVEAFLKREDDFEKIKNQYKDEAEEPDKKKIFELPARDMERQTMLILRKKWIEKSELKEVKNGEKN